MANTGAEVQRHLDDIDYPCQKEDLVRHAESRGAPDEVLEFLRSLPLGQYTAPTDVTRNLPA